MDTSGGKRKSSIPALLAVALGILVALWFWCSDFRSKSQSKDSFVSATESTDPSSDQTGKTTNEEPSGNLPSSASVPNSSTSSSAARLEFIEKQIARLPTARPSQKLGAREATGDSLFLTNPAQGEPVSILRDYLDSTAEENGYLPADLIDARVTSSHQSKHNGVTHIYMRQNFEGIDVYQGDMNANVARDGSIINVHSSFVKNVKETINLREPVLSGEEAVLSAASYLKLEEPDNLVLLEASNDADRASSFSGGDLSQDNIPAKLMYFPLQAGKTRLAWNTVIHLPDDSYWLDINVDAETGDVLSIANWVAHVDYRVFPLPVENPDDGSRVLVADPHDPVASPHGWHDTNGSSGIEHSDTRGINVNAQEDADANNTAGYRPTGGYDLIFDFPLDLAGSPDSYKDASLTNLFYWNNILHDIHYHYGFDEPAGNFQLHNRGNGGMAGDPVEADSLDGSGSNNANFATPPDGQKPRMQMFVWTGAGGNLRVNNPLSIQGDYEAAPASFGPAVSSAITSSLILADDGSIYPTLACDPLVNGGQITGNIALIDRGGCNFVDKVRHAQQAGAIGVVIANDTPGGRVYTMGGNGPSITIPAIMVSYETGQALRDELDSGVSVTLTPQLDRDSSLDNLVVIHEYGHGVSNRLTGGAANSSALYALQSRGMGEGWSDWWGLVLTAKPGDTPTERRGVGSYLLGQGANGPGIRPSPYTTDFAVNSLTFGDLADTSLSVPHGIGTIWATALWEMYWNLVDRHGFDADFYTGSGGNNLALQLVMDGLKMQPANPTYLDARDAILLADQVNNGGANQDIIWQAFAKRGMGYSAYDGGTSSSTDVIESFDLPDDLSVSPGASDLFLTSGEPGGPFVPTQRTYTLENMGAGTLDWDVNTNATWLSVSPLSGTLNAGQSATVTVSLNANANSFPLGVVSDPIVFRNIDSGIEQRREVSLSVNELKEALDLTSSGIYTGVPRWYSQSQVTHDGVDAARSATITHDEATSMQMTVTGPDTLVFWWKVSSEEFYDTLNLSLDGVITRSISGEIDWTQVSVDIPAGDHIIEWEYSKDLSVNAGLDAAWVDEVQISGNQAPIITSRGTGDGRVGEPFTYQIEATASPTSYGSDPLPAGLGLDTNNGLISGSPLTVGDDVVNLSATNAVGTGSKDVTFRTRDVATLPFFEDFESGGLNDFWLSSGTNTYRNEVTQTNGPFEGDWHFTMDSAGIEFSRNELTLAADLSGQEDVLLTFWAREYGDESHGPPNSPFQRGADFDGVAVSEDGIDWYEVKAMRGTIRGNYTLFAVELDKEITDLGLNYSSAFRIRFNHFDNEAIPEDGIAIDDIRLQSIVVDSTIEVTTAPDGVTQIFSGVGTPGAWISLISNRDGYIGEVEADGAGNWSISTTGLRGGNHRITVSVFGIPVATEIVEIVDNRPPSPITNELVPFESTWKYLDDGSDQYTIGTPFYSESYDDSGWAEGVARFGYGGDGEVTTIDFGPDSSNKYITTYFRKTFEYEPGNTTFERLMLSLYADDGVRVYLNGVLLHRYRVPASADHTTLAGSAVNGDTERRLYDYEFDPSLIREGQNTVAVSLHQRTPDSEDAGFDMRLALTRDWFLKGQDLLTSGNQGYMEEFAAVDINQDGKMDLVYNKGDEVYFRINLGNDLMGDPVSFDGSGYQQEFSFVTSPIISDLNKDGYPDLILKATNGGGYRTYLNTKGNYDSAAAFQRTHKGGSVYEICVGDLDGDGFDDLVYQFDNNNVTNVPYPIYLWRNDGTGDWVTSPQLLMEVEILSQGGLKLVDMDGDGDNDLVIGTTYGERISYFENDGNGNLTTEHILRNETETFQLFIEDVDVDGDPDFILNYFGNGATYWHENDGSGNLGRRWMIQAGENYVVPTFRDVDDDGDPDMLYGFHDFYDQSWYRENDGKGNFVPAQQFSLLEGGSIPLEDIDSADWDGDGHSDIFVAHRFGDPYLFKSKFGAGPRINSFTVDDNTVEAGDTVTISWQVEGAVELLLDGEAISGATGSVQKTIGDENTEFILIASNSEGTSDASVTVFVPDPVFSVGTIINEGTFTKLRDIALGDLDGDGLPEVVVADELTHRVAYIPNEGGGNFGAPVFFPDALYKPSDVEVADFDGDNINDIVVLGETDEIVAFYKNTGGATFGGHSDFSIHWSAFQMWTVDFDNNDIPDLLVPDNLGNHVHLNNGTGTFGGGINIGGNQPDDFALVDVTGDGIRDWVSVTNTFTIYPGLGPLTFSTDDRILLVPGSLNGNAVHAKDFTGDGELELLLTYNYGGTLYRNQGFDQWSVHSRIERVGIEDYGDSVVEDFDQDGDLDVALSVYESFDPGSLYFAENDGTGTFSQPQTVDVDLAKAYDLYAADMDGDGKIDLVRPGNAGTINFFRNISGRPDRPFLSSESDTGGLDSDNVTSSSNPDISGYASPGATVIVYSTIDGVLGTTTADANGFWSVTGSKLSEGTHQITVSIDGGQSSSALTVFIDTVAAIPENLSLTPDSDSGVGGDGITNIDTPTINGISEPGAIVEIYSDIDGMVGSGSANAEFWITTDQLSEGEHQITAKTTDLAGNVSEVSSPITVTIDVTPPPPIPAPDLISDSDTGSDDADDVTADNTPTFEGTANASDGKIMILANGQVVGEADAAGNWSITTNTLPDDTYSVAAVQLDEAGNATVPPSLLTLVVDTTAPTKPSPADLEAAGDTGSSNTDNITSNAQPAFTGSSESGTTVRLYSDNVEVAAGAGGASWSITPSAPLAGNPGEANATRSIVVEVTDLAGNKSVFSDPLNVTFDVTPPTPTVELHSGQANPARFTPITFTITFDENVYNFSNTDLSVSGTANPVGTVLGGGGSSFTAQIYTVQREGTVVLSVANGGATDLAGNASAAAIVSENSVVFESGSDSSSGIRLPFSGSVGSFGGSLGPAESDFYTFTVTRARGVRVYTTGSADTVGSLFDESSELKNDPDADDDQGSGLNFLIDTALPPGTYTVRVAGKALSGDSEYDLRVELGGTASSRPDSLVGPSPASTVGDDVYGVASTQAYNLVSKKARRVSGWVSFENDGELPDTITVRGSNGNRFFTVAYISDSSNVTGDIVRGTFTTPEMKEGDPPQSIFVTVKPKRSKLLKKKRRKGKVKKKFLRKRISFRLTGTSDFDTDVSDLGIINVRTK